MDNEEVTEQILGAWDEIQAEDEQASEEPVGEQTEENELEETEAVEEEIVVAEEEPVEDEPETDEEADEDDDEGEEADEEEPEEEPVVAYETDDIEIRAFLAKYGGDLEKALRGAVEVERLITRQGREKNEALERVAELETELEHARALSSASPLLNDEQRDWVENAVNSGNPAGYVSEALRAGEYELARSVCREWAREDPYQAMRAGQFVDQAEAEATSYVEPIDMGRLLEALKTEIPELPNYSSQMVGVLSTLGDNHPLVQDARSADISTAARGIVGIYELARASSATVKNARENVRKQQRENGAVARRKAVVSSSSASPSAPEPPRAVQLGPGLTLESLEAEFARQ